MMYRDWLNLMLQVWYILFLLLPQLTCRNNATWSIVFSLSLYAMNSHNIPNFMRLGIPSFALSMFCRYLMKNRKIHVYRTCQKMLTTFAKTSKGAGPKESSQVTRVWVQAVRICYTGTALRIWPPTATVYWPYRVALWSRSFYTSWL